MTTRRLSPFVALLAMALGLVTLLAPRAAEAREVTHKVQKGQYLNLLAKRYHTTAAAIMRRNKMRAIDLKPGMTLVIVETPAHRAWREAVERRTGRKVKEKVHHEAEPKTKAKPKPKKKVAKKAKPKKAKPKKAKPKKVAEKAPAKPKKAAPAAKDPPREIASAKHRVAPRDAEPKAATASEPEAEPAAKASPVKPAAVAKSYAKEPKRPGYITLVRYREKFRGQLVASNGKVVAKSSKRVDRLLRSLRTGKKASIDRRLLGLLATVSDHFGGRTIEIVSGFRPYSPKQYTRNSRHNHGKAVDFRVVGVPHDVLFDFCRSLDHVGCGYYPNSGFIHMDVRKRKTQWTDYSRPGQPPRYAHRQRKRKRSKAKTKRIATRD